MEFTGRTPLYSILTKDSHWEALRDIKQLRAYIPMSLLGFMADADIKACLDDLQCTQQQGHNEDEITQMDSARVYYDA